MMKNTINKKIITKAILIVLVIMTCISCPITAHAKTYPKNTLTIGSTKVKIVKKKITIKAGQKIPLNVIKYGTRVGKKTSKKYKYIKIHPTKIKWRSTNKKVATINKKGIITAKKAGKTVITGKFKKTKYKITVIVKRSAARTKVPNSGQSAYCSHSWTKVYKTVHHDAVTHKEIVKGGTEQIWHNGQIIGYQSLCECGTYFNTEAELNNHQLQASLNNEPGHVARTTVPIYSDGYYETVNKPDKTITVIDKQAYDEKVFAGYKCKKCGKTKLK